MGLKLQRAKKRNWLLTLVYRASKWVPLNSPSRFKLFLELEWIFNRLAVEQSFKYYTPSEHPHRKAPWEFLKKYITTNDNVLDLGCKYGELSSMIASKAKYVIGIDYDDMAIQKAKAAYGSANLEFVCAEALEYLKNNELKFDVLILSHILEHLDQPKEFIEKFKSFFKNIYIELPDYEATYNNIYRFDIKSSLVYTDIDHISEFDRRELSQLLADCNISIVESDYRYGVHKLWCVIN
jgi:SAM-dependent methyltransferase